MTPIGLKHVTEMTDAWTTLLRGKCGDMNMMAVCLVPGSYSDFSSHPWVCNSPVSLDAPGELSLLPSA